MESLSNELLSKLSPAAYAALMTHLAEKQASELRAGSFGSGKVLEKRVDPDVSKISVSADNTLAMKLNATQGLDVSAFVHVNNVNAGVDEDFSQSQFWYTSETSTVLAKEALSMGGTAAQIVGYKRVAFVSCPSAFNAARNLVDDDTDITLFEYDTRFADVYGDQFCFFDFNRPTMIPEEYHHVFDFVMADPPYLDENCLTKTVECMRLLARDENTPLCFNTGAVMAEALEQKGFKETRFHPEHASKLGNEFSSFTTYPSEHLGGWYCDEK